MSSVSDRESLLSAIIHQLCTCQPKRTKRPVHLFYKLPPLDRCTAVHSTTRYRGSDYCAVCSSSNAQLVRVVNHFALHDDGAFIDANARHQVVSLTIFNIATKKFRSENGLSIDLPSSKLHNPNSTLRWSCAHEKPFVSTLARSATFDYVRGVALVMFQAGVHALIATMLLKQLIPLAVRIGLTYYSTLGQINRTRVIPRDWKRPRWLSASDYEFFRTHGTTELRVGSLSNIVADVYDSCRAQLAKREGKRPSKKPSSVVPGRLNLMNCLEYIKNNPDQRKRKGENVSCSSEKRAKLN